MNTTKRRSTFGHGFFAPIYAFILKMESALGTKLSVQKRLNIVHAAAREGGLFSLQMTGWKLDDYLMTKQPCIYLSDGVSEFPSNRKYRHSMTQFPNYTIVHASDVDASKKEVWAVFTRTADYAHALRKSVRH